LDYKFKELGKGGSRKMENIQDLIKYSVEPHSEIENLYYHNVIDLEGRTKLPSITPRNGSLEESNAASV
jgi:hypothetical protein